jgi:hypothetical protein
MACELHRIHRPRALTVELHHVLPQAWQHYWTPGPKLPAPNRLFDPRTVALCPTSHRNVHYWIVKLMRAAVSEDPLDAKKSLGGLSREQAIAYDALTRWREAGGSLAGLRAAGLFGEA